MRKALERFLSAPAGALLSGFAGLLLLMAGMGIDAAMSVRNIGTANAESGSEVRRRDRLLDQLRGDIYRSSTVLRDQLLEPDDALAADQQVDLQRLRARIGVTLRAYQQDLPAAERSAFAELSGRVGSYWKAMAPVLHWNTAERRVQGRAFLQEVAIPMRTELVELTRQINALNERDFDAAEQRTIRIQSHFRRRVVIISGCALVLGLVLGFASIRRVQYLERETKARFAEVDEARRELQRLSERLVNAQEEERRNLARELHDGIGQALSAMLVELGRAETAPDGGARLERLASARRMAETSVGMVRNMALLLRPSMLDDLGLVAALKWQAREVTRRSGLKVKMATEDIADDLPDSHRTCLYRVVQEALDNCVKHARASQVRVVVHRDRDGLSVTVQDDGAGFEPGREKGMGLLGMEERIQRLGGVLSIDSKPGHGTVLSIQLPV